MAQQRSRSLLLLPAAGAFSLAAPPPPRLLGRVRALGFDQGAVRHPAFPSPPPPQAGFGQHDPLRRVGGG